MAIQMRRGHYAMFDPTRMLPGEYAVVLEGDPDGTDGYAVYMCYASGVVKRLMSADDVEAMIHGESIEWTDILNRPPVNPGEGVSSVTAGYGTTASGMASDSGGHGTIAKHWAQRVFGTYNTPDPSTAGPNEKGTYIEIVGNGIGTGDMLSSNARTLDWSGNEVLKGKLTVGAAPTADMDVATKKYVDDEIGETYAYVDDEISESAQQLSEAKADKTFNNPDMGAGYASQLVSSVGETDSTPYNLRKVPYDSTLEDGSIVGASVVWNQFCPYLESTKWTIESGVTGSFSNGIATLSSTTANNGLKTTISGVSIITGHKYFISCQFKGNSGTVARLVVSNNTAVRVECSISSTNWESVSKIVSSPYDNTGGIYLYIYGTSAYNDLQVQCPLLIDLTQMFGTTIADYVYGLETANAGAGLAWLQEHFPMQFNGGYQEYSKGEIKNISGLKEHKGIGFNQWDEEFRYGYYDSNTGAYSSASNQVANKNPISVFPNAIYSITPSGVRLRIVFLNANMDVLSIVNYNGAFNTPSDCRYINFNTFSTSYAVPYSNDICINLSKTTGTPKNGDYVPYESHTYSLDSTKTLRGLYKLDANNKLYADGDKYSADGTVTRKRVVINGSSIGKSSITTISDNGTNTRFWLFSSGKGLGTVISDKAPSIADGGTAYANYEVGVYYDNLASYPNSWVMCMPSSVVGTTQDSIYNWLQMQASGPKFECEASAPTTETASPYGNPQVINPDGTESYVYTDGAFELPVGHSTFYPENLRKKLEQIAQNAYKSFVTETVTDTAVASFTDGADDIPVKSLSVDVNPVQDLHGYSNPWPAGGGKNKLNVTLSTQTKAGVTFTNNGDGTIKLNGTATEYTFFNLNYAANTKSIPTGSYIFSGMVSGITTRVYVDGSAILNYSGTTEQPFTISESSAVTYARIDIATGASFNNVTYKPMIRPSTVSDATFAPYSNICPISGWTSANVTRTGGSLIRIARTANTVNGITFSENSDGTVHVSGTSTAEALSSNTIVSYPSIDTRCYYTVPAGTYTLTNLSSSASVRVYVQFRNASNTANVINNQTVNGGSSYTFTVSEPTIVYARVDIYSGTTVDADVLFMMTKGSSAATVYEPWKQTVYPITFPASAGTVYGGTLDVTSGVLTVDRANVDMGTLSWFSNGASGNLYEYAVYVSGKAFGTENFLCSIFKVQYSATENYIRGRSGSDMISVLTSAYTTAASFKTAMSGQTIVYELATPVTYQLTPTEVTTLLRNNNIFADTGNVSELTYRADTKAYIDGKLG